MRHNKDCPDFQPSFEVFRDPAKFMEDLTDVCRRDHAIDKGEEISGGVVMEIYKNKKQELFVMLKLNRKWKGDRFPT